MERTEREYLVRHWLQTRQADLFSPWRFDSAAFIDWVEQNLGPRPSPNHVIGRKDGSEPWMPGNLDWVSMAPSYHDLHIETANIRRQKLFNLPYGLTVSCNRTTGWRLYSEGELGGPILLAGEYDGPAKWLRLDVNGYVIVDSRFRQQEDDDGEHRQAAAEDNAGADASERAGTGSPEPEPRWPAAGYQPGDAYP